MSTHEGKCFHLRWWSHCNWELSVSLWIQVRALPWTPVEPQSSKSRNVITLRCRFWCHYEITWWKKISQFHTSASQHFRGLEIRCGRGRFSIQQDSLIQHSWPVCAERIKIKAARAVLRFLFSCPMCFLYFNVCFKNLQWLIQWSGCVYTVTHCFSIFIFFPNLCYFSLLSMLGQ